MSAFHWAVDGGQTETVELLLQDGVPVSLCKTCAHINTVYVQIFDAHKFRRLHFPNILRKTIFADQEFQIYGVPKFCELNFHGLLGSAKPRKLCASKIWVYMVHLCLVSRVILFVSIGR